MFINNRRHTSKRWLVSALAIVTVGVMAACAPGSGGASNSEASEDSSVRIGTAGEGGTYYYLGTAMAELLKEETDLRSSAIATAGGTENLRRVASGDLDLAFATVLDLEDVLEGDNFQVDDFRLLSTGHLTVMQPVVRADSGISSLEEMASPGRRLGVGEPGSAVQPLSQIFLSAHGRTFDDIDGFEVSQSDAAASMKDGQLEGAYFGGGLPLSAVTDLTTTGDYRILPLDQASLEAYQEATAMEEVTVPAGTYKGQSEAVEAVGIPTILVVRSDMPEDKAKTLVEAIQENTAALEKIHPAGAEYTVEDAFIGRDYIEGEVGLEYHPGAVSSYEERGVWEQAAG